jgi:6-pyruvoyl-tetrahydropterin synthase
MTKIQINSLEALERLIGNDNELEIEIRKNIVYDFSKKHLKGVADEEFITKLTESLTNQVREEYFIQIKNTWSNKVDFYLNDTLKNLIRTEIANLINRQVKDMIRKQIEEKTQLENISKWITEELAPNLLKEKLDKLVDTEIKKRLSL